MKTKLVTLVAIVSVALVACAPRVVPVASPVLYAGAEGDVFAAIIEVVNTAPPLARSDGWVVVRSDLEQGILRVETSVRTTLFRAGGRYAVTFLLARERFGVTRVLAQRDRQGDALAALVHADLEQRFGVVTE